MLVSSLFPLSLIALSTTIGSATPTRGHVARTTSGPAPPALNFLLTASLTLGKPLKPIQIPGGTRNVTPILNGTVTGMIDGVITGGTAYPQQYGNQTVQVPTITAYGVTNDGYSFFIDEQGIGNPQEQITRIVLEIGGPYRKLTERFILAAVQANMDRTGVVVQAFTVGQAYRAGQ